MGIGEKLVVNYKERESSYDRVTRGYLTVFPHSNKMDLSQDVDFEFTGDRF